MSLDKFKIQTTTRNLINHFDPQAEIEVILEDTNCRIEIESEFSGLLIGKSGETLDALQHLLRLILTQESDEYLPVLVDISGYRALRQKNLEQEAREIGKKVAASGITAYLEPMSSFERRLVHLALEEIGGIETESVGEGQERHIVIKKFETLNPKS